VWVPDGYWGGGMSDSVSDIIGRLRFVSSPAPAIYLNEALISETFIAHLGRRRVVHSYR